MGTGWISVGLGAAAALWPLPGHADVCAGVAAGADLAAARLVVCAPDAPPVEDPAPCPPPTASGPRAPSARPAPAEPPRRERAAQPPPPDPTPSPAAAAPTPRT
ncbi:RNA polymerase subunit sigma-24, partial [Streptomyces sp. NPDC058219]